MSVLPSLPPSYTWYQHTPTQYQHSQTQYYDVVPQHPTSVQLQWWCTTIAKVSTAAVYHHTQSQYGNVWYCHTCGPYTPPDSKCVAQ
eukprot:2769853-Rhodomonas_salina.1